MSEIMCKLLPINKVDLRECCWPRSHQDLSNTIMKTPHWFLIYSQEALGCSFLGDFVLEIPDSILVSKLLSSHPTLGQDATFKTTHVEQQVRIVFTVHRNEAVLPLYCGHRAWQAILYVPEYSTTTSCKIRVIVPFK